MEKWETIIHTVGRGDPFERTLPDIEVPEEQPRSYEQRTGQFCPQQGAVWVKASMRLPGWKVRVKWRLDEVERGGRHPLADMAYEYPVSLYDWEWYDEAPAKEGNKEREAIIKLREYIRDCAENWDCDTDSHKYNLPCRKCEAQKLHDEWNNQQNKQC